ncbi:MAG: rod shape-determining protein MreC [Gammaproteobacteria bacterium]|nr:rod shape-determining protein MreC [Gammaproteobacteria bacterium]
MATAYSQNDDKPLFPRGLSLNARAILLCLFSVILLGVDQRTDQLQPVRRVLSTATYPIDILAAMPSTVWNWASDGLSSRNELQKENEQIKRQLLLQNARLQRMDALYEENRRLRALLKSSSRLQSDVLVAEIIAVDMDPYRHTITLNKGLAHKIYDGQPLLDAYGVLGQVNTAAAMSSTAVLITDADHAIPVSNNRSGIRTVAYGTGKPDVMLLPHVPNHSDIKQGDLLVTSGLGERFPAGYPVAIVTEVKRDYGQPFATITAKPTAHVTESRHVLLAWHQLIDPAAEAAAEAAAETQTDSAEEAQTETDKPVLGQP